MCSGGWYTFSFRYAQAFHQGSLTPSRHYVWPSTCPTEPPRACVVLAVLRGFFFLLMARQIHRCPPRSACKSAAMGGSIIPGQGFLLGIAPAGWQNACGDPRVSIPGLAGLACVFPQPWEGHQLGQGLKGLKGTAIQRHRPPDGRCAPVRLRYGHTVWAVNRKWPARRTDGWSSSRTNHQTNHLAPGRDADADAEVSSRAQS